MKDKKIVVIGGGTGAYGVLKGIKHIDNIDITAIVTSADSGGSTGILRDEFGTLPVGDFRQALVALADEEGENNLLRELFQYRFAKGGSGLEGHSFGNLYLTALSDILGSEELALRSASKLLKVKGRVFPVTMDNIQLVAEYENGTIGFGEAMIDSPPARHDGTQRIVRLWTQPEGRLTSNAKKALEKADYIIMGPGDLYTSLLATLVVGDVCKVIRNSDSKLIFLLNLVTKFGQTTGFKSRDFVEEVEKYIGRSLDYILINSKKIPPVVLRRYRLERAYAIKDNLGEDSRVVRRDFLSDELVEKKKGDKLSRSLIRHDSMKIKEAIESIIF